MDIRKTPLERAFEMARSGEYASVSDIKKKLHREGVSLEQISGGSLMKQLREILNQARADVEAR
ncbi:MAG TPA: hypothetical protein VIL88_05765 [Devosia sp.]|jgi:hypothetical protein|uniref:hypothetical protein n=1 Tax=Devosia sp. TaxID=1871048 RepID=UPI002F946855